MNGQLLWRIAPIAIQVAMATAAAFGQSAPPSSATIEHATADDCEIIVAIGKARLNWGEAAPEYAFFPTFGQAGRTYVEDCDWKSLGIAAPLIGGPDTERGFYITRPSYDANGTRATADFETAIIPPAKPDGSKAAPFIASETCNLEKSDGRWKLLKCDMGIVT